MQDVNLLAQTLENVIPKAALKRGSEPLRDAWRKLAELDEQSPARAAYRADEKAWLLYFEMKRVTDAGSKYHVPDKAKYRAFLAELDTWEPKKIEDAFRRLVSENLSSELLQQLGDAIKRLKERTRITEPTAVAPADAHVDAQVEPSRSTSTTPLPFDPIRASATTALPSEHPTLPTTPVTPANPTNSLSSASRTQSPARFVRPYTQRGVLNSQGTPPVTKILVETQEKPFLQNLHSPSWENLGQIFPRTFRDLLVPRTGAGYRGFSAGVVLGLSNPVFRKDLYDGQVQLEIKSGHLPMLVEKLFNLEMKTEGNLRSYVTQTGQSLELSESENAPIKYQRLRGCVFDAITDSMFGAEMATAIRGSEQFKEDHASFCGVMSQSTDVSLFTFAQNMSVPNVPGPGFSKKRCVNGCEYRPGNILNPLYIGCKVWIYIAGTECDECVAKGVFPDNVAHLTRVQGPEKVWAWLKGLADKLEKAQIEKVDGERRENAEGGENTWTAKPG
ncbi:uncharacterized protein B0I36DRAFT_383909 [Microdochium trichocladiopsis]|uniref:Uncharacterized protein n=1 Tax=Microdochium trichocladiopsis TaxID=1682393 RepID=A0A9P9BU25_9PEZI|nr:uncharacterized protein B0I36DRAFT_383909 [Microdochium trichocladiopsis]KAH7031039.1 hypothetical protein B0I36DRAFT_383909 [Microdochium trichocladiopsis]